MVGGLKSAHKLKETKDNAISSLCLYFFLHWIISPVKQDQNSSLLYLKVFLWLCSSSAGEGPGKCCFAMETSHSSALAAFHPTVLCFADLPGMLSFSKLFRLCFDICFSNCIIKNTACLFHILLAVNFNHLSNYFILLLCLFWKSLLKKWNAQKRLIWLISGVQKPVH